MAKINDSEWMELRWRHRYTDLDLGCKAHLARYGEEPVSGSPSHWFTEQEYAAIVACWTELSAQRQVWSMYDPRHQSLEACTAEGPVRALDDKAWHSWVGVQGGIPSRAMVEEALNKYYVNTPLADEAEMPHPSDWVMSVVAQLVSIPEQFVISNATQLYHCWNGDHRSNGGVTYWADRRLREAYAKALSDSARAPEHIDPCVTGTRVQRNKPIRLIFMDAFANQFRSLRALKWWHDILACSDAVAWRGDRYVERHIFRYMERHRWRALVIETDYESMDTWVSLRHALWVNGILGELFPHDQTAENALLKALFTQEVITPAGIRSGKHDLLSGQPITNDLESWLNLLIQLMWLDARWQSLTGLPRPEYGRDFIIVVLGDDAVICVDAEVAPSVMSAIQADFAAWVWDKFRIKARADKQWCGYGSAHFCKRTYVPRAKGVDYPQFTTRRSIYPIVLAMNSIVHPEDADAATPAGAITRAASICDNAWGHPDWKWFVSRLYDNWLLLRNMDVDTDWEQYKPAMTWRIRLYGESFDPSKSPTLQYWLARYKREHPQSTLISR